MFFCDAPAVNASRETSRSRFTIVELLVVVAILAILMSLLLPSLKNAMVVARNTACLHNQRQVGLAIELYANDYEDCIIANYFGAQPPAPPPYGDARYYSAVLGLYLDDVKVPDDKGEVDKGFWNAPQYLSKVFMCPDKKIEGVDPVVLTLACNQGLMVNKAENTTPALPVATPPRNAKLSRVTRPQEIILIVDAPQLSVGRSVPGLQCPWGYFYPSLPEWDAALGDDAVPVNIGNEDGDGFPCGPRYRHMNESSINALYPDGHASSSPIATLLKKNFAAHY